MEQGKQLPLTEASKFILAGNAVFTLVSGKTGVRFTYKVTQAKDKQTGTPREFWFVSYLSGPNNKTDYSYAGVVDTHGFRYTGKSPSCTTPSMVAIKWFLGAVLTGNTDLKDVEFWHEGRCGRCGDTLTVPQSIDMGFGPVCAKILGLVPPPGSGNMHQIQNGWAKVAGTPVQGDFNETWANLKNDFAQREKQQEEIAFMSGIG